MLYYKQFNIRGWWRGNAFRFENKLHWSLPLRYKYKIKPTILKHYIIIFIVTSLIREQPFEVVGRTFFF